MSNRLLIKRLFLFMLFAFLYLLVFRNFFTSSLLVGGDFQFNFSSMYGNYNLFPYAWDTQMQNGIGGYAAPFLWTTMYFSLVIVFFGQLLHLSWNIIERLCYFYPYLILSFLSSFSLFKKLFPKSNFIFFAPFIFIFNTYALLLIAGQPKVALAYALLPLILLGFINLQQRSTYYSGILFGSITGLLLLIDIRIAYEAIFTCLLFFLLSIFTTFHPKKKFYLFLFLAFFCAVLLNAFWLVPSLIVHQNPFNALGNAYSSTAAAQYLSFAKFENSFSLLHPNWPDNIFGKVYFMRWEFLFVPIFAFSSLLFVNTKMQKKEEQYREKNVILFFALLGLVGAFLAKGAND